LARALDRGWAAVHALGIAPDDLVTLEVAGRGEAPLACQAV
jgi:hypothetical protein